MFMLMQAIERDITVEEKQMLNNLGIKRASFAVHFDASIGLDILLAKVRAPEFRRVGDLVIFILANSKQ